MLTPKQLETFLRQVDGDFPVPLSQKQELTAYAQKLYCKATLCASCEQDQIQGLVAGYTEDLPDGKAYIAIVAVLAQARGKGLAAALVGQFLQICRQKHIAAVHLYADSRNTAAMKLYQKLGFQPYTPEKEPRPQDAHLIFYLDKEK